MTFGPLFVEPLLSDVMLNAIFESPGCTTTTSLTCVNADIDATVLTSHVTRHHLAAQWKVPASDINLRLNMSLRRVLLINAADTTGTMG